MFEKYTEQLAHIVTLYPNKPAIIYNEQIISYRELHLRSNQIANYLLSLKPDHEQIIPLILERDCDTVISMVAILKAGCAFLPISPSTPCSRIKFILEDTAASIVMSNIKIDHLVNEGIRVLHPASLTGDEGNPLQAISDNHLAYVMYTSGSTGDPKGVLIEHRSMMNLFKTLIVELELNEKEMILALTDYTFDISLIELLMPLLCGASILLTEQGTVADGVKIKQYLEKNSISLMQATPLSWEILLKQGWKNDGQMKILVGGEKFKTRLAELLNYSHGNIWNMYGPTETSMWSMIYPIHSALVTESVPLGKPVNNTCVTILDEHLNPVEPGVQGQLYIGGMGLARGYLNKVDLTCEKFFFHPQLEQMLYKTGDWVIAYDAETICYLGRSDDQLKFGGIRIESGEIETVIEQEPFVKKAVVKVHETEGYYKSLAAYIEVDEEVIFSRGIQVASQDVSNFLKNIYDEIYRHAKNYEHGFINNCGWQSSFTGQLFGVEELNESYHFIREVINQSSLSDVLEVGCGTGSLLVEYIDKAQTCTVVEISSNAINYVRGRLSEQQKQKVIFKHESVLNVHKHQKYSCVIINSVIQYLPSINALITTLTQLVRATKSGGVIIIGDVRSLELMDVYLLEKLRRNTPNKGNIDLNLSSLYYKSRDAEIVLSPKFFYALKDLMPDISYVDISVKHGDYKNELNYFRYDVVLSINRPVEHRLAQTLVYSDSLTKDKIIKIIEKNPDECFIIRSLPNLVIRELLGTINKAIPHNLPLSSGMIDCEIDPKEMNHLKELLHLKVDSHEQFVHYDEMDPLTRLELHLYPKSKEKKIRFLDNTEYKGYRAYCREPFNPWLQRFCFDHVKLKVSQHIVSWVNPSVYVWIEKWPLGINGKLDKKRLELPVTIDNGEAETTVLEQLQRIWRNITGDNALLEKEFWVHGVSSLCMYFFLATINETFLVNINYHEFRDYNTLDKLAAYIEHLLGISSH